MHNLNQELLKHRMMRGALSGQAEQEKAPLQYCKGKLDNGFPCRIVPVSGEEYCRRHKKEVEALEAGAPLPPGRVERVELVADVRPAQAIAAASPPPQDFVDEDIVVLHFREEADRQLLQQLREISNDLEGDILALLHLAAGR